MTKEAKSPTFLVEKKLDKNRPADSKNMIAVNKKNAAPQDDP